jgi:hypothetical protein
MVTRYSKQKLVGYKQWRYRCTECDWATGWLEEIKKHTRQWSREGQLIPHHQDSQGHIVRTREVK